MDGSIQYVRYRWEDTSDEVKDSEGNESYYISEPLMLDNDAGEGGINIFETYDNDGKVNVAFDISEDPEGYTYSIAEDEGPFSEFEDYVDSIQYTFLDQSDGEKTLRVKYKDPTGNVTEVIKMGKIRANHLKKALSILRFCFSYGIGNNTGCWS